MKAASPFAELTFSKSLVGPVAVMSRRDGEHYPMPCGLTCEPRLVNERGILFLSGAHLKGIPHPPYFGSFVGK